MSLHPNIDLRLAVASAMNYRARHRPLLLGGILALVSAALLVAYLQRRFAEQQREQTAIILQQFCDRTATLLADQLRHLFEAVVPGTVERFDHLAFLEFRPALLASEFENGLQRHQFLDRFFMWSEKAPERFQDEVLFYRPASEVGQIDVRVGAPAEKTVGGLFADPGRGREILAEARKHASSKRNFAVVERLLDRIPYQIVIHYQWEDAGRDGTFGIVGYTVNLSRLRNGALRALLDERFHEIVGAAGSMPRLSLIVTDDQGSLVHGRPTRSSIYSASVPLNMFFFPSGLESWLSSQTTVRPWHVTVSVESPEVPPSEGYGLFAALMSLIFVALFCAVAVNRQSARLSEMHADFVANVSHQLKTPLSLLAAASETLRLGRVTKPERLRDYAEVVHAQTGRLSALVEQILRFSRIDAGQDVYELERVDLVALVRGSLDRFELPGSRAQVPIRFDAPDQKLFVEADPTALEDVVINLLDNAVKYGDASNQITVRVHCGADHAVITVRDRGRGIEPSELGRVFDKFYRGRQNGHRQRGFGLGLAIVHEIVRAHRGRVAVESELGRGSEFRVVLPRTT